VPRLESVTDFYIPARAPQTKPRRTLKHDDSFLVIDSPGDIGATVGESDGLFHRDTRYLARLELLVDGAAPLLLGFLREEHAAHRAHHVSVAGHRVSAACRQEPWRSSDRSAPHARLRQ